MSLAAGRGPYNLHTGYTILLFAALFIGTAWTDKCQETTDNAGWAHLIVEGRKLRHQSRYAEAETILRQAVASAAKLGNSDPRYAETLTALAIVLQSRGAYDEAEDLLQSVLRIWEQNPGESPRDLAVGLSNMANLLRTKGKYPDAERFQLVALRLEESDPRPERLIVSDITYGLGAIQVMEGRYTDAESTLRRALAHPLLANALNNLGLFYFGEGRIDEAEALYRGALEITQKNLGADHPDVARILHNLASVYQKRGRYAEAESLYLRAPDLQSKAVGNAHPDMASTLINYADLLRKTHRKSEARKLLSRAHQIQDENRRNRFGQYTVSFEGSAEVRHYPQIDVFHTKYTQSERRILQ